VEWGDDLVERVGRALEDSLPGAGLDIDTIDPWPRRLRRPPRGGHLRATHEHASVITTDHDDLLAARCARHDQRAGAGGIDRAERAASTSAGSRQRDAASQGVT